ncbi:zinc finger, CCHC-type containing protein [Tanacetum coccineum]
MASIFSSKSRSFMTMSIPPQDEPSISQPVKYDDSSEEELEEDENVVIRGSDVEYFDIFLTRSIIRKQLEPRKDSEGIRGIRNFTGRIKGMHIFVGNFTYVSDFMIVEDISSIIDPRLSQVVLGKPFVEISNMTHDLSLGVVKFTNESNEIDYKMPQKIKQYNSLSDMKKEHMKSVYLRNEEDKRKGVEYEKKLKFVEQPIGPAPDPETANPDTIDKYYKSVNLKQEVACLMLSSMSPDLQMTLEKYNAYDMMKELKTMFEEQAKQELFETVKAFHACKQEEGQSVSSYLLKMKSYLDTLEHLGYAMPKELGVSLILNSLNKDYDQFAQNYNMHSMGKKLAELHAMLKLHEKGIPKKAETPTMLAIRGGRIQKDKKKKPQGEKGKGKGKNKLAYDPKPKIPPPPKREHPKKDSVCHHCKEVSHWRRNCLSYPGELKKRKNASVASTSGIFTIELYAFPNKTYVYDTGYGTHISVEAIKSFDLILPSGLIVVVNNCHFAPTVTRGVVSISHLVNNGYIHTFTNYGIYVSKDNVFYFNAIPRDGIYEIDMHNLYPNVSSMYNVSNNRAKHGLDSYYLWHCRLGHINKKRMDMLQRDGLLQPTHDESHDKCKSCISQKMVRKPFPHQVERAKDILGLIHTDVCGPFRTVSREGASYFITFTDDFSRYGFVYLMKHKHEVFETFKVFQNEVENQLGKKIKAIRSDRGGEYLSHEFINHMKSCGIVSQLTPPYTPQHNGVSERRNRTLLDMVRSMMNLTTLPKSFWGYALETAARILNIVPTKKVDRKPYEIWHGKSPKFSYLRVWGYEALVKRTRSSSLETLSSLKIVSWYKKRVGVMCDNCALSSLATNLWSVIVSL